MMCITTQLYNSGIIMIINDMTIYAVITWFLPPSVEYTIQKSEYRGVSETIFLLMGFGSVFFATISSQFSGYAFKMDTKMDNHLIVWHLNKGQPTAPDPYLNDEYFGFTL